ncbi:MAG: hypothetical protein KME45_24000 [Stenomitos rutilans HA7619-LM2]|nr:hypothetical protein [Stenomitos rutilans HA7619-LM2]
MNFFSSTVVTKEGLHRAIDWQKPSEFLDKEFQQIAPDTEIGKRYAVGYDFAKRVEAGVLV